jgi:hypothetical protein
VLVEKASSRSPAIFEMIPAAQTCRRCYKPFFLWQIKLRRLSMTRENIRLGWESIARENALAYFPSQLTVMK